MLRTLAGFLVLAAAAQAEPSLGVRVNRALDRAAANLISRQDKDGSWQRSDRVHPLGRTALCTYALLHAGVPRGHQAVQKALKFLRFDDPRYHAKVEPHSTYEAGCLLLLLHALGPGYDAHIKRICRWLVDKFHRGRKLWGYPNGTPDLSNTQYAVFGLRVGEMHGFKTPKDVWRELVEGVAGLQHRDGAFRYHADEIYRASMTHAALLVFKFAGDALHWKRPPKAVRDAIAQGHAWYRGHYRVDRTPWGRGWHKGYYYYYMYGLARYAQIYGLRKIGEHDWYREGAEELLRRQEENGSWGGLADTSFAIRFLRKAVFTAPRERALGKADKVEKKKKERPKPKKDAPAIRTWLLAGPYRVGAKVEDDMLYTEHFPLKRLAPADGRKAGRKKWFKHAASEDKINLRDAGRGDGSWATFYAATYLHAAEATDAVLWIASDDGSRAFLDGKEIHHGHHHDYCGDDFYRVPVKLKKGRSLLVVKVENHGYDCFLRVRVSAPDGAPHPGVRWRLKR